MKDTKRKKSRQQWIGALFYMLIGAASGIVDLHRSLMICDRMFVELIGENRPEIVEAMFTKEQKKLMKAMHTFPSVLRTEYAYALLAKQEEEKAEKIEKEFDRFAARYPYSVEITGERELMEIAERCAERQ